MENQKYLLLTLKEALNAIKNLDGGPFGAVIIQDNKIISSAHNTVLKDNDPTAHAEINAIRLACKKTKNFHLKNSILFTNVEPCPMCLSAAYWANIKEIIYITDHKELSKISDFDDAKIYNELNKKIEKREIKMIKLNNFQKENEDLFNLWSKKNLHY